MKKIIALLLALTMLIALPLLTSCNRQDETEVRVWTLNGTTGFGMAPLMNADKNGSAALHYTFKIGRAS
ncbi:MAG: hypothetical protein E7585_07165, partial [Ruminococcaceae bacterium]|nr:hypothetical protein [Oscillospiraceae bacterium]